MATHHHRKHAARPGASTNQANGDFLSEAAQGAGIKDSKELANFMGQMQVESAGFKRTHESLGYSGDRLEHILTNKHGQIRNGLTSEEVRAAAKGGEKTTAAALYGGDFGETMGNRKGTDDSYTFRGRGFVQLTGRSNYEHMGKVLGLDLANNPDLAAEPKNAARIAVQYWKENVVARHAQHDVNHAGRIINGGTNGRQERTDAAAQWEAKLSHGYKPGDPEPGKTLQDKQHPGHAWYEHALHGLQKWNQDHHIKADPVGTRNAAAALAVEAHHHGLKRIDQVEPNDSGNKLIAVQGTPGTAQSKVIDVSTMDALNTSVTQSSRAFAATQLAQHACQSAKPAAPASDPRGSSHDSLNCIQADHPLNAIENSSDMHMKRIRSLEVLLVLWCMSVGAWAQCTGSNALSVPIHARRTGDLAMPWESVAESSAGRSHGAMGGSLGSNGDRRAA